MNQNHLSLSHSNVAQTFKLPLTPSLALYIVLALFLFGLAVSILILVVVHNPLFFLFFLLFFGLIVAFLLWNSFSFRNNTTILHYLHSLPDSDLTLASHGQLVKITGVIPLIKESRLVTTGKNCKVLASHLRKWLRDRNLSSETRLLRLEEGYVKEGDLISVFGILQRSSDVMVVTPQQELISTGCIWKKLLLPVDIDGLILAIP
ncbi:unnamed protein product [Withania somnifera]